MNLRKLLQKWTNKRLIILFHTILPFCLKLACKFSCAMWVNLCNIGAAFAATSYYQRNNQFKIKIAGKWCYSDNIGFLPVQCCPISIKTTLNRIFSCVMFSGGSRTTLHKIFTCAILSQKYSDNIEPVQCCFEPIGQHCTRFLPVQCCPKSIKTTSNRNFSCVMLSRDNWITLYKVFTCAMLSQ